jgi:hypothetical protein
MLATRRRTLDERGPGHTVRVERVGRAAPKTVRLEARRGLTVGLAVGGYGAGSAIFGPLAQLKLIPAYGLPSTFRILAALFFVMTTVGALLLRNPPAGYKPAGWPPSVSQVALTDFAPSEVLRTRTFYLMWIAYALGTSAGLMVMSQVVPFAKSVGIAGGALSAMTLVIGACGNAMGRTFSGWMSDRAGRIIVLRAMIGLIAIAMAGRQLRHALHRIRPLGDSRTAHRRRAVRPAPQLSGRVLYCLSPGRRRAAVRIRRQTSRSGGTRELVQVDFISGRLRTF